MSLINLIRLLDQIHVAITDDQVISQKKWEANARVVDREWLDKENSPTPTDFSGMVYKQGLNILNWKNNGCLPLLKKGFYGQALNLE